jgi:hypothetical protein
VLGELIAYFSFTTVCVFDTSRKNIVACTVKKPMKEYYSTLVFVRKAVETASYGMIFIPSIMTIGSGIQVVLRLLPQQFEGIQCCYYRWERFLKFAV